ncbi:ORF V: Enzymatic polyprotein [Labeo rohita]|uniref:ORF V: Enzymatic polyprotein n=1 Tax=Labeo rohita TaxID=84645 RepID=A0ABQ8KZG6_LABRO|nr:ORF V: Enzymatic polyprotein [Labeo rohita]
MGVQRGVSEVPPGGGGDCSVLPANCRRLWDSFQNSRSGPVSSSGQGLHGFWTGCVRLTYHGHPLGVQAVALRAHYEGGSNLELNATCGCTCQKCGKFEEQTEPRVRAPVLYPRLLLSVRRHGRSPIELLRPRDSRASGLTAQRSEILWEGGNTSLSIHSRPGDERWIRYKLCIMAKTHRALGASSPNTAFSALFSHDIPIPGQECYGPLSGDRSPPGKGAIDPIPSAKMKGLRLVDGIGPERHVLSCLDPPRLCLRDQAHQYKVLPAAYPCRPAPLRREVGIRILNYLDNWLFLAHSWDMGCVHRDMVLNHWPSWDLRACTVSSEVCGNTPMRSAVPLKQVQRLLGHMASSAAVTPLGLMHMRPLQHWLHTRVPRWAWHQGTSRVNITPLCRQTPSPWTDIVFLWSGVPLEQVSRRIVVTTDASKIGWGATCDGQAASGVWTGPRLFWHINCLELLAVLLALRRFRPRIQGKHVLVRSDNTATVAYINHQGDVRSFRMSQLARHLLLWSQHRLKSLCTTHIPGGTNRRDGSLCLTGIHPLPVVTWSDRGPPRVRRTGTQLAEGLAQVCVSSSEPHRTNFVQSQGGQGTDSLGGPLLAQQNLVLRPGAPGISPSLVHSSEGGPPFSGEGHILAPAPQSLEPPPMVPGRDQEDFRDPFLQWDPRSCGIESVLSFLQKGLDRHLSASTLRVHVAAISANHDLVGGRSVGKHDSVSGLQQDPIEPLQSVRALRIYMEQTQPLRCSEQLLSVTEDSRRGKLSPSRGSPTGWQTRSGWPTGPEAYPALWR